MAPGDDFLIDPDLSPCPSPARGGGFFGPGVLAVLLGAGGLEEVAGEEGGGDGPGAAGDGGNRAREGRDSVEVDIADEATVDFAGTEVDDDGAGLDHCGVDQAGAAGGGEEDVSLAGDAWEVAGAGVAGDDRAVGLDEQAGEGAADDGAATEDDGQAAGELDAGAAQDLEAGQRGARDEGWAAEGEATGVEGVEALEVFREGEVLDQRGGLEGGRERELEQDGMDVGIGGELGQAGDDGGLGGVGGEERGGGGEAMALEGAGDLPLVVDGGGVIADAEDGEVGDAAAGG